MAGFKRIKSLVRGDYVITNADLGEAGVQKNAAVVIDEDGKIAEIGDFETIAREYPETPQEGGKDCLIMPGLIDAHCHGKGVTHVELGLGYHHLEYWNTMVQSLAKPDPYLDALWCGIKHLKSGCTTLHHMNNTLTLKTAEAAIKAYGQLGMRWAFSLTIKDQNLVTYDDEAFLALLPSGLRQQMKTTFVQDPLKVHEEYFGLVEVVRSKYQTPGNPIIHSPMGPQWCSRGLLERIKDESDRLNMRIHIHALQTPYQKEALSRLFGHSGIQHLKNVGVLGSNLTLGHGVWLNQDEIDMLAEAGCSITHHASCNLNMRNGILPVPNLLSKGVLVAIGIDDKGINDDNDMMQELRVVEKLHRISDYSITSSLPVRSDEILAMGTINGARVLGLERLCGTLEVGKAADLIVVNIAPRPWINPKVSPFDRVVLRAKASDIRAVFVEGKMIVKEGVILTVNEEEVVEELAKRVTFDEDERSRVKANLLLQLQPYVADFYNQWKIFPDDLSPYYVVNRKK